MSSLRKATHGVRDGSKTDEPFSGQNPLLSALVRKRTNAGAVGLSAKYQELPSTATFADARLRLVRLMIAYQKDAERMPADRLNLRPRVGRKSDNWPRSRRANLMEIVMPHDHAAFRTPPLGIPGRDAVTAAPVFQP